ncbi:MAG: DEAD/DEAH box helicase [Clostridiales bacterium]|nr:DEAD/DEAH box helicase [Clostridiales bacterium]
MADFAPGMRVIIRDEEWMIKKCETNSLGNQTLQCVGISPLVKDKTAYFLSDLERVQIIDPAKTKLVTDNSARFTCSRLFIESLWRQKIPTDARLHIGHHAVMNVLPYQLEPAKVSLRRPKQRILMADAVGLGKTLEAGILMSELIARGKGQRILVVTVKSMMAQFQKEMWERFTIPLISLDSAAIQRIRRDLPTNHNPFHYYDKTIVSIDTIKRDVEYRTHLENAWWDIIVIDEAHNVARRGHSSSGRSKLASLLAGRSDTLIMLSATPHDGSARSFASLMNMLDPTAIPNPDDYTEQDIKDNGSDIKGLFLRRFKKDIQDQTGGKFMERHVSREECAASPKEEAALAAFVDLEQLLNGEDHSGLKSMVFKKAMFSSPAACIKSLGERMRRLEKNDASEAAKEKTAITQLIEILKKIEPQDFSRYVRLLNLLRDPAYGWNPKAKDDRLVIFTERIETMRWLKEHLQEDLRLPAGAIQEIHGGMSDVDQQKIVENFGRDDAPIRILVASDVASEGLNLHFLSHRMIHFDIPWSLMVFQQRNGRIDRYGQTREPDIRYLVINTRNEKIRGDIRILEVLIRKEEQAAKNIGDPALLMNVHDTQKEEEITAQAMEQGDVEAFDALLTVDEEADIWALLGVQEAEQEQKSKEPADLGTTDDITLMTDIDYLNTLLSWLSQTQRYSVTPMDAAQGLTIAMTDDMRRRWRNVLPPEAQPSADDPFLRLSPDKDFCDQENRRSLRNALSEDSWPKVHYLWKLHPMMQWANDKACQFFGRQEAPLVGLMDGLDSHDQVFVIAGLFANRRSTPVVDEWFALRYRDGQFVGRMTMDEVLTLTKIKV